MQEGCVAPTIDAELLKSKQGYGVTSPVFVVSAEGGNTVYFLEFS